MKCLRYCLHFIILISFCQNTWSRSQDPQLLQAVELSKQGLHRQSQLLLEALTRKHPQDVVVWFNLGNSYFRQTQYAHAESAYRQAAALKNNELTIPARFYLAISLRMQGRFEEAETILDSVKNTRLKPQLKRAVENEIVELRHARVNQIMAEAVADYDNEKFQLALEKADRAITLEPDDASLLLKAMAELRLGKEKSASVSLEKATRSKSDALLNRQAQLLYAQVKSGQWENPRRFYGLIDLSGGYNSNIFINGHSENAEQKAVARALLGGGYVFSGAKVFSALASYQFSWDEIKDYPSERFQAHVLQVPLAHGRSNWNFQVVPLYTYQYLNSDGFLQKYGATLKVQKSLRSTSNVSVSLRADKTAATDSAYTYLEGPYYMLLAEYQQEYSSSAFSLGFLAAKESIGDLSYAAGTLPLAHYNVGPQASLSRKMSEKWNSEVSTSVYYKKYYSSADRKAKRTDYQFNLEGRISYDLRSTFEIYFSPSFILNRSTLNTKISDKNYEQVSALLGVNWKFF